MKIEILIKISAGITAIIATVFAVIGLIRLLFPIKNNAGYSVIFDGSKPDEIWADITNISKETQYITKCSARIVNPMKYVFSRLLRKPMTHPKWYKVLRFGPQNFDLLGSKPRKIDPLEVVRLSHKLRLDHPLNHFFGSRFLVEVKLSNGRIIRSKSIVVPVRWQANFVRPTQ